MAKSNKRVQKSKQKLLEYIERQLPKLQFTSGDISKFIGGRPTYQKAWEQIRQEGNVVRLGKPKGVATSWRRNRASATS